jgi:hypothetical protein
MTGTGAAAIGTVNGTGNQHHQPESLGGYRLKTFVLENLQGAGTETVSGTVYSRPGSAGGSGTVGAWSQRTTFGAIGSSAMGTASANDYAAKDWKIDLLAAGGTIAYRLTVQGG